MRPLLLKGHSRPITQVKFNREGDLFLSSGKDTKPCLWRTENGERVGTYNGHTGAVWSIDADWHSKRVLTGSADNTIRLWELETGKELYVWKTKTPVRYVEFSEGDKQFLAATDQVMGLPPTVAIYTVPQSDDDYDPNPIRVISPEVVSTKVYQAHWGPLNKQIFTVDGQGCVIAYDAETLQEMSRKKEHTEPVVYFAFAPDKNSFVTASKDHFAKLWDTRTMEVIKTYDTGRPCNAGAISPTQNHLIIGGGQSAATVTTTKLDSNQFRIRFFHKIYEDELASLTGHFGPVHTLIWHPNGKTFISGGEDGYVRVNHLGDYEKVMNDEKFYKKKGR